RRRATRSSSVIGGLAGLTGCSQVLLPAIISPAVVDNHYYHPLRLKAVKSLPAIASKIRSSSLQGHQTCASKRSPL
ncbi:MAG: hypothetical protein M3Y55_16445, partial [Pseudomonadota bacterium]|nr:hypothetical protein [Pseudomonadota bacterium]